MLDKRPNILFFFTDDQRFSALHALGNDQIHTPNLDALIERGTAFTHAHIPGGSCGAVCMPSRAMLHSGRTLFHIDGYGEEIRDEHATIGSQLSSVGYTTFGTGKWHNGRSSYSRSFSCGDQIFFGGMADHWNVPVYRFDPTGKYEERCPYIKNIFYSNNIDYLECDHIELGKHSTDVIVNAATNFIEGYNESQPFFMYVSLLAPHDPRTMPQKFMDMYDPAKINLPDNFATEHTIDTGALKIRDERLAAFPRDPDEIKRHIAEYYGMISHLDDSFGILVSMLKDKGELENTIIVFAGDNGLALGQHGLMGKQSLYDHSVRVPLVFSGPGIPAGKKCDSLVYLLDIFPTLCDLVGVEVPKSVEGESLVSCLNNHAEKIRNMLYLAYGDSIRGVTNGQYKLIEYACGQTQIFNLIEDPLETLNLAEADPALLKHMRQDLLTLSKEWDDEKHETGKGFWSKRQDLIK